MNFVSLNSVICGSPYFQEVEEILELLKSTWRVLGITETIHHTCYAWVLFRQVYQSHFLILFLRTIVNFIVGLLYCIVMNCLNLFLITIKLKIQLYLSRLFLLYPLK